MSIAATAHEEPALVLDLDGFEGPIDLLLTLAREQKVDLAKLSILALADQYLAFIAAQTRLRLEIAAGPVLQLRLESPDLISAVNFSSDGKWLVVKNDQGGANARPLHVWESSSGKLQVVQGAKEPIHAAVFSPKRIRTFV